MGTGVLVLDRWIWGGMYVAAGAGAGAGSWETGRWRGMGALRFSDAHVNVQHSAAL